MQHNRRGGGEWPACYGRRRNEVRVRFYSSLLQRRTARLLRPLRQRPSASDSILRRRNDLPHPILFFVAAKENGSPAAAVVATTFRVRFYFSLSQRRIVSPAVAVAAATFCIRFYFSLPQRRIARLQRPSPQRPSVSDSNFRCRKGE